MTSPPWFRFYSEILTDRKIERICRWTDQPKMTVIGAWSVLMALANDSPVRGALLLTEEIPFVDTDLADEMGTDVETLAGLLDGFTRLNMLHQEDGVYYLTNWDERQFASDSSTERVRRFRERQKEEGETPNDDDGNDDETLHERYSNLPDTDTDTEQNRDRTETEQKKDILAADAAGESVSDYDKIRESWLDLFPNKPQPRKDNGTLQSKVKTRMKSAYFRDHWRQAMKRASRSSFLNAGGFFDLGWFLKNDDNWQKCLNGNYDDKDAAPMDTGGVVVIGQ